MNLSTFSFKNWLRVFFMSSFLMGFFFLAVTEVLIRLKVEPQDVFEKHRDLFFVSDKVNAVFGDSHGAQDFTGEEGFVNLSYPSESVGMIDAKIRLYFTHRQPKQVILQADPHMFSEYRIKDNLKGYLRLFEVRKAPLLQILTPRHRKYLFHYWKAWLLGSDFKSRFQFQPDGSQLLEVNETKDRPIAPTRAKVQAQVRLQKPQQEFMSSKSFVEYREMLNYLKSRGAQVCMVTFPVSPDYANEASRFKEFEEARQYFSQAASKHGFSYSNYWSYFQDPSLFGNEDHLNPRGAKMLTKKILRDCFQKTP